MRTLIIATPTFNQVNPTAQLYQTIEDKKLLTSILLILALSTLIDGLDSTIVNVALPTMGRDFDISIADSSWIPVAYTVAMASLILPFAMIARNGWVKEFFLAGTAIFTLCSMICGIADGFMMFIIARLIQGVGAAMVTSAVPLMIVYLLPKDYRGRGMAILGLTSGLAIVLGPTLGGIITSVSNWHWIFLVNIPIGIVLLLWGMKIVPGTKNHSEFRYPDAINSILSFLGICFALTFLQNLFETSLPFAIKIICGVGAAVTLSTMVLRSHVRKETAIISGKMLLRRDFAILCITFTLTTVIISGTQYVLPFYLEYCQGYAVSEIGYLISVASLFTIALSFPIGKWCDAKGCKVPAVGAGVFRLVFTLIFALSASNMAFPILIVALAFMGISMACAGTGLATSIIHHSDAEYQDEAATFLMVVNYVAASLGVAFTSMIYTIDTSGSLMSGDVLNGFLSSMWTFVMIAAIAIIGAMIVPNIIPDHDNELA